MEMADPVVSAPSGLHRKATRPATRSGETKRPDGWREPADGVAGDVLRSGLQCHGAGKADQRRLGRHVIDPVRHGAQAEDRGDVDDAAEVALARTRRVVWNAEERLTASARSQSSGLKSSIDAK
jgi:hypothetical protein